MWVGYFSTYRLLTLNAIIAIALSDILHVIQRLDLPQKLNFTRDTAKAQN